MSLLMLIGSGVATSISIHYANAVGAQDRAQEQTVLHAAAFIFMVLDASFVLFIAAFPDLWAQWYSLAPEASAASSRNQVWALGVFMVECPMIALIGIGRAKSMVVRLPAIKAMSFLVVALPIAYWIVHEAASPSNYLLFSFLPAVVVGLFFVVVQLFPLWRELRRS